MQPRKLTVLRIDDKLPPTKELDATVPQEDMPPEPIELFTWGEYIAINSWEIALHGWSAYKGDQVPDLIVADVRFNLDTSTPLSELISPIENLLPTGLSHLKPFAAMARAVGVPVGIGMHTADPGQWARLILTGKPLEQCMGYLAAHDIGELAAILGDTLPVAQTISEDTLEPYWKWLQENTEYHFPEALRAAIRNYRKRLLALVAPPGNKLPGVLVMPDDYVAVMEWCARMKNRPQPIDASNDPGLILTYSGGKRESIFLASLFADVRDITTRRLDASCFETSSGEGSSQLSVDDLSKLDYKGSPRIGAFLERFDTLKKVHEEAARVVFLFSDSPDDFKKGKLRKESRN